MLIVAVSFIVNFCDWQFTFCRKTEAFKFFLNHFFLANKCCMALAVISLLRVPLNYFIQTFFCAFAFVSGDICCFGLMYRIQEEMDRLSRQNVQTDNSAKQEMVSCFLFSRKKKWSHTHGGTQKHTHTGTERLSWTRNIKNSKLLASLPCRSSTQSSIVMQRLTVPAAVSPSPSISVAPYPRCQGLRK